MVNRCQHFDQIRAVTPRAKGCEECLAAGDAWIGLRLCLTCGHVGCCDDSKNRHATAHFNQTQHPLIRSLEPGEKWGWCYLDNILFEKMPRIPRRTLRARIGSLFNRARSA
jgi:K+:H+ antiporter